MGVVFEQATPVALLLQEIAECLQLLTILYVLLIYGDIIVSVRPALFMPPPEGMDDLVHDDSFGFTEVSNGNILTSPLATNVGVTAAIWKSMIKCIAIGIYLTQSYD